MKLKEFLADLESGSDEASLMEKYELSRRGLQSLLEKLPNRGTGNEPHDHGRALRSERRILKHRVTGDIIFSEEASSVRELAESAVRQGVPLAEVHLTGKMLAGADLSGADLQRANLSHADLSGANLARAYLAGADLTGANLSSAWLEAADLLNANLTGANFNSANLSRANLSNAGLTAAILTDADLSYCSIVGGNITAADLRGANLEGVSMHRVVRDKTADIKAESRERLSRFVFRPVSGILLQLFFFAFQVFSIIAIGPFVLFWFVGIVAVNVHLMLTKSWWWALGLAAQLVFLGLLFLAFRKALVGF